MTTRAKFTVCKTTQFKDGYEVTLTPVIGGSPENESFFKWTPTGSITMGLVNESTAKQFVVGESYYVDFTKAEV